MKSRWKTYLLYASLIIVGGGFLFGIFQIILAGYSQDWTGFGEYKLSNGDIVGEKKLWDWMGLLVIPLVLAIGVFFLNRAERKTEREIAKDGRRETALQSYIDRLTELLLEKNLLKNKDEQAGDVARIRTLTVLRGLDENRKGLVVKFLHEANLIMHVNPIISLASADLSNSQLKYTNLQSANFIAADLENANLEGANLKNTLLVNANLNGASLKNANLDGATLDGASLKGATMPDGTKHE